MRMSSASRTFREKNIEIRSKKKKKRKLQPSETFKQTCLFLTKTSS